MTEQRALTVINQGFFSLTSPFSPSAILSSSAIFSRTTTKELAFDHSHSLHDSGQGLAREVTLAHREFPGGSYPSGSDAGVMFSWLRLCPFFALVMPLWDFKKKLSSVICGEEGNA
jgi:hypothetical protein